MRNLLLSWLALLATSGSALASDVYVPEELEPWVDWVLHEHPRLPCPRADASRPDSGLCVWAGRLAVDVDEDALAFRLTATVFAEADVTLPGDSRFWPREVSVNGRPAVVIGSLPAVRLPPGEHDIRGSIGWVTRPDGIRVPAGLGLVTLNVDGQTIARPTISNSTLFFGERELAEAAREADAIDVDVYRLLIDGHPLLMETQLDLFVGGRSRIETLGRVLLPGFELVSLESEQPARISDDGNLRIQVEAGQFSVVIVARATGQPSELSMEAATDNWPVQEIWAFEPRRDLRIVRLSGAGGVDLQQAGAPFEGDLQGFLLNVDSRLAIETEQRGDPNPVPNEFTVSRDLWLNFDGSGYVVRDALDAEITRASRLSASYPLGRIAVNGESQLVTAIAAGEPGIELQTGSYAIESVSALDAAGPLTAVGWNVDAKSLDTRLHLPPGWRLLWAGGVDLAPTSWIARWSLWDVFLITLVLVLAWRFLSRGFAALVVVTLLVAYQESPELGALWLLVIALVTLQKVAAPERLQRLLGSATVLTLAAAVIMAAGFAVDKMRQSLYPQLETRVVGSAPFDLGAALRDVPSVFVSQELSRRLPQSPEAEVIEEVVVTGARIRRTDAFLDEVEIAEGALVQTGPALPSWRWSVATLRWFGPVNASQEVSLALLPPAMVRLLSALMAVLALLVTAGLVAAYFRKSIDWRPPRWLQPLVPALLLVTLLPAGQAWPSAVTPEILRTLEQRLLAPPECAPGCASIEAARLFLEDDELRIVLRAHVGARVAVAIPGDLTGWSPDVVAADGAPLPVSRDAQGRLSVALEPGLHEVEVRGPVGHLNRVDLTFPLNPGSVELIVEEDWQPQGLIDGRLPTGSLSLERVAGATSAGEQTLQQDPARPFVELNRSIHFGREWRMLTYVSRVAPERGAFTLRVPLLAGESVLDESLPIEGGSVVVSFSADDADVSWRSTLSTVGEFELLAGSLGERAETWELLPGNLWHVAYDGMVPSKAPGSAGAVFHPHSAEVLTVFAERTQPIPGPTVTVESVQLNVEPGQRMRSVDFALELRASEGGNYPLELPPGAVVTAVAVDGEEQPIPVNVGVVALPLVPGAHRYAVAWRNEVEGGFSFRSPEVTLASPANNVGINVTFPRDRWVLGLGGPRLGPAILVWGLLIVVTLLGVLLSRVRALPLTTLDGLLLAVGLTLCNLPTTLLVAAWFLLLLVRERWVAATDSRRAKNLIQFLTGTVSVMTIVALVLSVPMALLGSPDMQITGNQSSSYVYRWFQDHAGASLPTAWVFSLPLWVYRGAMLAWSLWLAFALLRWIRWAWGRWATPQWWYRKAVVLESGEAAPGTS